MVSMQLSIYVPIMASIVYLVLIVITVLNRPLTHQHKLFLGYLIAAFCWSSSDFYLRNPALHIDKLIALRMVIIFSMLWVVQLYSFCLGLLAIRPGFSLKTGYFCVAALALLCAFGNVPPALIVEGHHVQPVYGPWLALYVLPMAALAIIALVKLIKRIKGFSTIEDKNKIQYLLIAILILAVFGFIGVTPLGKEIPVSHIGGLLSSLVLTYSVARHDLISIDLVFRKALGWVSVGLIGLLCFNSLLILGHFLFGFQLNVLTMVYPSIAAIIVWIINYFLRPIFLKKIEQMFYRERYNHRKELLDFVSTKIRAVAGMEELGDGLLAAIVKTLDCQQAMLLIPQKSSGDFAVAFTKTGHTPCHFSHELTIAGSSPILSCLSTQYLTRTDLDLKPELRGIWNKERIMLSNAGIAMLFPLQNQNNLIGILAISQKKIGKYTLEEVQLCESVSNTVAITLDKERFQSELAKREKQLSIINHLSAVINSSLNMQEVYDTFISELKQVLDIDYSSIGKIDDTQMELTAVYSPQDFNSKVGDVVALQGSGIEWLVLTKKYLAYPNDKLEKSKKHIDSLVLAGLRSMVFFPLIFKGEVIGILTLGNKNQRPYDQVQLDLLEHLASQISSSVANSQLYRSSENRARIDELTGLLNRRNFDESLNHEVQRDSRFGNSFSLIMLDLDNFKGYNDTLGHVNGDKLLKRLARIIQTKTRDVDTCFRYGGDEFAVILPNTALDAAYVVAERVRESIAQKMQQENIGVRVSLGVASWPNDGLTPQDLINAADQALYYVKRTGGNRVCTAPDIVPSATGRQDHSEGKDKETLNTIYALAATIEARDRYTYGHSRKVRGYAVELAEAIKLGPEIVSVISHAALLHDIGKIGIYDAILNKPDVLTADERELIKNHPVLSRNIVAHIPTLSSCLPAILHHHERWDGKGYPHGLKGENIPLEARILTIADSFDAMTSERPYRKELPAAVVLAELRKCSGNQFDPELIEVFIAIAERAFAEKQLAQAVK